ncbi:MAG TPA: glycosyltransferase family 87 protein [Xanthobacteraceae bacterium]|nr:glycosyltransferase family 87 protein [Xanthobacteraceae bacterium]
MDRVRQALRSGEWLTRERIRMVAVAVLIASVAGFLYLVVTAKGGVDLQGRPIGTDFSNVYAAGTYVLEGNPQAPFDSVQQYARERSIFGEATQFYGWHYPPYFLFVAAALAWMPYGLALFVWQAITLGLYLLAIRGILKAFAPQGGAIADPLWLLLALAFPAVLINVGHGHNGFLTAALLGGGLVSLERRPLVAGVLFGLLAYKPQFGLMIPIALAAGGYWRSFIAAAVTAVLLTLVTTLVFGVQVWHAFFVGAEFTRTVVLEQGDTGWHKIQSVFSWARMWGAPVPLAYGIQGAATLVIAMASAWLWHGKAPYPLKAAGLCLAAILATPYTLDYDMMVLAPAIAFLAADGVARGFGPWEKTALAALWLVPLVARTVPQMTLIPLGVPVMLAMFVLILRRAGLALALPVAFLGCRPQAISSRINWNNRVNRVYLIFRRRRP